MLVYLRKFSTQGDGCIFLVSFFSVPPRGAAARMGLEQPTLPYLYALVFLSGARRWFAYSDNGAS